jgi:hypothetical protein
VTASPEPRLLPSGWGFSFVGPPCLAIRKFCDSNHLTNSTRCDKLVLLKNVEEGETAMKQFFVLMVVLALAAGTATVVTAHPTSVGVNCADYSGAGF